jgi:hypothetical protein
MELHVRLFGCALLITRTYFASPRRFFVQRSAEGNAVEARIGPAFAMLEWGCGRGLD